MSERVKNLDKKTEISSRIVDAVESNNTYPAILDVFTSLDEKLKDNKMELNANLKGYLDCETDKKRI